MEHQEKSNFCIIEKDMRWKIKEIKQKTKRTSMQCCNLQLHEGQV